MIYLLKVADKCEKSSVSVKWFCVDMIINEEKNNVIATSTDLYNATILIK